MKKMVLVMAGLAAAMLVGEVSGASAQMMKKKVMVRSDYDKKGSAKYRPLTVAAKPTPGVVDGAAGVAGGVIGGTLAGAGSLIQAPFAGLSGGAVGISPVAAPPLPIEARYARTGKVFASYDQGYAQDVPVDNSGPIYKISDASPRTVTPFSLLAFPITAATSAITTPLRPVAQP